MKKGFTLVELLAVIIILGILAVIAVPIIFNTIQESREEANKASIDLYGRAVDHAVSQYEVRNSKLPKRWEDIEDLIAYDGNEVVCNIHKLNDDLSVYLDDCTVNGKSVEGYTYGKANVICKSVTTENKSLSGTIPNGEYNPGDEYVCDVNDTTSYHFYVLGTEGDNVNLIMDRNYTDDFVPTKMPWCISGDNNSCNHDNLDQYIEYIEELWTNVDSVELPTANQIAHAVENTTWDSTVSGTKYFYLDSKTQTQTAKSKGASNYAWLFDYTDDCESHGCNVADSSIRGGYWTASPDADRSSNAWSVFHYGRVHCSNAAGNYYFGVRPVITVSKTLVK